MSGMTPYLTVAQVAEHFGVSIRTVLRWIANGDMGAVRLPGGRLRISRVDLWDVESRWHTDDRLRAEREAVRWK